MLKNMRARNSLGVSLSDLTKKFLRIEYTNSLQKEKASDVPKLFDVFVHIVEKDRVGNLVSFNLGLKKEQKDCWKL